MSRLDGKIAIVTGLPAGSAGKSLSISHARAQRSPSLISTSGGPRRS